MNIENLKMFCNVVEEGSITQAAKKGFVSQPAVTKQIRQLENLYGTSLFDRSENKLILTEAGEVVYPYAKEIILNLQKSVYAIDYLLGNQDIMLNVGASLTIGEYILPGLLKRFLSNSENIKFNLLLGNTPDIITKLEMNKIDVALVEGIIEKDKVSLDLLVEKFSEDELVLVTPFNHRWKNRREINIEELTEEKMIWREPLSGTRVRVEYALEEQGILNKIRGPMELGSLQAIKSSVEAGLGISILPKLTIQKEIKYNLLRLVKIKNFHLKRDLYLVKKKTRFSKVGLEHFIDFISKNQEFYG
ncbi:LysR family transcriptional regulator [Virgibacillus salexigens]|uniref:LysR family transcriptional regulator n=1 Tax=Virgibacillus salexigens TaxID=61016 RepID=UPI00190CCD2C|nr:LysR family transcriptional regulator [Virgibacillus salexigens]